MKEYSEHPFYVYKRGLNILINMIGRENKYYFSALTFEQRLNENIQESELYGDNEIQKTDRAKIIYELNKLSIEVLNYSFNDLCEISKNDSNIILNKTRQSQPSSIELLPLNAWTRFPKIASNYSNLLNQFSSLAQNGEYEEAKNLYWQILYFTGTRELWEDGTVISKQMLKLSKKEKDYKFCGSILAKGDAYRLMSIGNLEGAEKLLKKSLEYFNKDKNYRETGVFYNYLAELYENKGNINLAIEYYKEARKRLTGIDEHKVHLKRMFVEAKNEELKSKSRIIALTFLREEFSLLKTYREAMADIELSKSLYILKDPEALLVAQHAYNLLKNEILMPRNTYKAEKLLKTIKRGEALITK